MRCVVMILALVILPLDGQQQSTTDNPCSIDGQIVRAVDGEPLKSARLSLVQVETLDKPQSYKAVSDAKGRFQLTGVAPGRYRLTATRNGYAPQPYQPEGADRPGTILQLKPAEKITKLLFRMIASAA